jgi:CRP/FNR family transcriptional regulator, dissimilatory nitrate respiration regulator
MKELNKTCAIFKGFSQEELEELILNTKAVEKHFKKGEYLVRNGSFVSHFYVILDGMARSEILDNKGKLLKIMEHTDVLAADLLFSNKVFPVDIIAQTAVKVLVLQREEWMLAIQKYPRLMRNFLEKLSESADTLLEKIKCLSFRSLRERYIVYILSLADEQKTNNIIIHKSQNELAQFFGVNRPSLGREVREMHNQGLIEVDGKKLFIPDRKKLESYISVGNSKCINCMGCGKYSS